MKFATALIASLLMLTISSFAAVLYVPAQYPTIQDGINASANGDTVAVAPGIYVENLIFNGHLISLLGEAGPDATILEGQAYRNPIVTFAGNEDRSAVISGFIIRNSNDAPAISIENASPTITGNVFSYNYSHSGGGGIMAVNNSFPRITYNYFDSNGEFGAIYVYQSNAIIAHNVFRNNYSSTHGGAIFLRQSTLSAIYQNLFYQNNCLALGGAVCLSECNGGSFYNNTLANNFNVEPEHGGGLTVWYSDNWSIYNNIIVNNTGKGLYSSPSNNSSATYNDIWGNTVDIDGITPGTGSLSVDPLFDTLAPFMYTLQDGSPCIDAGDPASPLDPDGSTADMGASDYSQYVTPSHAPRIIYVPAEFATIKAAIEYAVHMDSIYVSAGTYSENLNFLGKNILILGVDGPENCIIRPAISDIPIVKFTRFESNYAILSGFTITGAIGVPAIFIQDSSPSITNNIFEGNSSITDGGCIEIMHGTATKILSNIFRNNHTEGSGGGVHAYGTNLTASGNLFQGNQAGMHGGGLFIRNSQHSIVDHNVFDGNECQALGGALCFSECTGGDVYNNTIIDNTSLEFEHGAGITVWMSNPISIFQNIVAENHGKGLYSSPTPFTAAYNDVFGNDLNYSGIEPGIGAVSADPLLVGGTYELNRCSPCIDGGNNLLPGDPDGTIIDIGAFYRTYFQGDVNCSEDVNGIDAMYLVNYLKGIGAAPKPILSGDVNGNCHTDGMDVSYFVNFLKGIGPALVRGTCAGM